MVLMCIERMMVMINFTMMTIALIRHITTAKALPSHVGLIAWFQWVVCVNGTLLFGHHLTSIQGDNLSIGIGIIIHIHQISGA